MLELQGGVCAICKKPPKKKRLEVDHDHRSGIVRGLLCWKCNHLLLPPSGDDPALMRAASEYLEKPPALWMVGTRVAPPKPKRKRKTKKKEPVG